MSQARHDQQPVASVQELLIEDASFASCASKIEHALAAVPVAVR